MTEKRKTPARGGRRHPEPKSPPAAGERQAGEKHVARQKPADNPQLDVWMKEISQSLADVKRILDEIRAEAFVRAARIPAPQSYLDFRQPRRSGDTYQNAAYPGSPNQGAKHDQHGIDPAKP